MGNNIQKKILTNKESRKQDRYRIPKAKDILQNIKKLVKGSSNNATSPKQGEKNQAEYEESLFLRGGRLDYKALETIEMKAWAKHFSGRIPSSWNTEKGIKQDFKSTKGKLQTELVDAGITSPFASVITTVGTTQRLNSNQLESVLLNPNPLLSSKDREKIIQVQTALSGNYGDSIVSQAQEKAAEMWRTRKFEQSDNPLVRLVHLMIPEKVRPVVLVKVEDPQQIYQRAITVYSKSAQNTGTLPEDNKISYWLKKLYYQQKQKVIDDKKKDDLAENKSATPESDIGNNTRPQNPELDESSAQKRDEQDVQYHVNKKYKEKQQTEEMVRKSNRVVLSISTVFPWNIFPTTVRIQENKVCFLFRQFMTSQEQDVDIKDISNTHIEQSFFFASLKVISNTFANEPVIIEHLKKKDALRARMLIQGLQLFNQKNIDTSNYEIKDLIDKLEELQLNKY